MKILGKIVMKCKNFIKILLTLLTLLNEKVLFDMQIMHNPAQSSSPMCTEINYYTINDIQLNITDQKGRLYKQIYLNHHKNAGLIESSKLLKTLISRVYNFQQSKFFQDEIGRNRIIVNLNVSYENPKILNDYFFAYADTFDTIYDTASTSEAQSLAKQYLKKQLYEQMKNLSFADLSNVFKMFDYYQIPIAFNLLEDHIANQMRIAIKNNNFLFCNKPFPLLPQFEQSIALKILKLITPNLKMNFMKPIDTNTETNPSQFSTFSELTHHLVARGQYNNNLNIAQKNNLVTVEQNNNTIDVYDQNHQLIRSKKFNAESRTLFYDLPTLNKILIETDPHNNHYQLLLWDIKNDALIKLGTQNTSKNTKISQAWLSADGAVLAIVLRDQNKDLSLYNALTGDHIKKLSSYEPYDLISNISYNSNNNMIEVTSLELKKNFQASTIPVSNDLTLNQVCLLTHAIYHNNINQNNPCHMKIYESFNENIKSILKPLIGEDLD